MRPCKHPMTDNLVALSLGKGVVSLSLRLYQLEFHSPGGEREDDRSR